MPIWSDFFRLFQYASEKDPLSARRDPSQFGMAGIAQPEAIGTDFTSGTGPSGTSSYRQTYDMIDTTTLSNRAMRYKEYERLRNVPEIEMAITVFSDEACVAGDTKIATPFGFITIKELTEKRADERFLVYCYDFRKNDYTLGWAFAPRLVKRDKTVTISLDDGSSYTATADHRVLKRDGSWTETGSLKFGDELMPFYRKSVNQNLNKLKTGHFPRIYSHNRGWIHERQFVDDWKNGKITPQYEKVNRAIRMVGGSIPVRQIAKRMAHDWKTIDDWIHKYGFTHKEIKFLYNQHNDVRKVVDVSEGPEQDVYDLSVDEHQCFATDSVILHNCQKDEQGNILKVVASNDEIREEIEFLLLHRKMLNLNRNGWTWFKNLCISGDWFVELVVNPDSPKEGIYKAIPLPPETMYRIETVKGKLVEFQQSKEGPDYQAITKPIDDQNDKEIAQTTAIRFSPHQIVHFRIGDDRKTFFPYGQSLIEPARGPAHSLRMMEDAMVTYRLCLVGDTRIRTPQGHKEIKDIEIGDIVYCLNNNNEVLPVKVTWFVNNGIQKTLTVKTKHTKITGTVTHPLLVNRNGIVQWVDLQDIQPKIDKLVNITQDIENDVKFPKLDLSVWMLKKNSYFETIDEEKLKAAVYEISNKNNLNSEKIARSIKLFLLGRNRYGLRKNHLDVVCKHFAINENKLFKTKRKAKELNLPEFVNEDFARLFGFMLGDGSIRRTGTSMCFAASPDSKLNDLYRRLLQNFFGNVHFDKDKRSNHPECGNYVVSSVEAVELMLSMGYCCNTKNKRIPEWVYTAPKKIRRAFIEGISDADGCERFTKAGLWFSTISMSNEKLIQDIKEIWHSIGLCSGQLSKRTRKSQYRNSFGRQLPETVSYQITITDKQLPKYDTIWSVEEDIEQFVYDFTVDHPNHNFVANGICSANTRAPERRVFYIDVGQLPPFKAEAFIDRIKDQFRKRKIANSRGNTPGANSVEERWQPPAQDEDYWLPIRPNNNTRIETLPGAENLGEIDDAVYFRNKLFTALNFPKTYLSNEDANITRISLSAQDIKFARMIERLQSHFEDGILDIAERHLALRGYPQDSYQDLRIKMTPPSDWRELSRAEVITARYSNAGSLKSSQLMADYDIMTKILKYSPDDTDEMLSRLKIQKLEDLKLQVLAQNPQLLGVGVPGQEEQNSELGTEAGGPNNMPTPEGMPDMGQPPDMNQGMDMMPPEEPAAPVAKSQTTVGSMPSLPEPNEEDIKKFNLEIQDYEAEQDKESIDFSIEA